MTPDTNRTATGRLDNVYQLVREVSAWRNHYKKWAISKHSTPEILAEFNLLDEFAKRMAEVFGDPAEFGE